jgi:hypothetical protein
MKEIVLRSFETFDEVPEGLLEVKSSGNLMYVRIGRFAFIAREFIDNVIVEKDIVKYKVSYYNVKDNKDILTLNIQKSIANNITDYAEKNEEVYIQPLSELLNIDSNRITYLNSEDIDVIVGFKGEYIPGKRISLI